VKWCINHLSLIESHSRYLSSIWTIKFQLWYKFLMMRISSNFFSSSSFALLLTLLILTNAFSIQFQFKNTRCPFKQLKVNHNSSCSLYINNLTNRSNYCGIIFLWNFSGYCINTMMRCQMITLHLNNLNRIEREGNMRILLDLILSSNAIILTRHTFTLNVF